MLKITRSAAERGDMYLGWQNNDPHPKRNPLKDKPKMARTREVFPTSGISHKWAHQTQTRARNPQGNLFFEGPTIYSYRTSYPIARIYTRHAKLPAPEGVLVLVNSERYSVTTAGHISNVKRAAVHLPQIEVPYVEAGSTNRYAAKEEHDRNLQYLAAEAARLLKEAQRVIHVNNVQWRRDRARELLDNANAYMKFFGIRRKPIAFPQSEWTAAGERVDRLANPDPIRDAKRFRERERRQTKMRAALQSAFDSYCKQVATYNAAVIEARKNAPDAAAYWREHGKWPASVDVHPAAFPWVGWSQKRKFESAGFALPELESTDGRPREVLLRVNGEQIETSLGARVPLAAAPMVWLLVQREKEKGGREFSHIGAASRIRIGDYPIDRIEANGDLHAGCHHIQYAELERMARQLGLIEGAQT